jgi:hypothetical protein
VTGKRDGAVLRERGTDDTDRGHGDQGRDEFCDFSHFQPHENKLPPLDNRPRDIEDFVAIRLSRDIRSMKIHHSRHTLNQNAGPIVETGKILNQDYHERPSAWQRLKATPPREKRRSVSPATSQEKRKIIIIAAYKCKNDASPESKPRMRCSRDARRARQSRRYHGDATPAPRYLEFKD